MKDPYLSFDDLSVEEQTAVTQLKQRMIGYLSQHLFDDLCMFVRFLRARDLNINAAESMLKKHIEWRRTMQIDSILTNYISKEVQIKYVAFNTIGVDIEGSPVLYIDFGKQDPRGILKSMRKMDALKYVAKFLESNVQILKKQSLKLGRHVDKFLVIMNFEGLTFAVATHKETLDLLAQLLIMYEANYPERLKSAYLINCSIYFTMGFAVVKHLLSGPTYRKIKMFGKDGWMEELTQIIDPEILPAFLGGERTDPDGNPLCNETIIHGSPVPKKYYIKKKQNSLMNKPGVETLTVTRMSKKQLTFTIKVPGSHLLWEFETKARDIGFSLLYKENEFDPKMKVLIPKQRIDTDMSSETGLFKCEDAGIYIIEFDNSFSWIRQKEIYFKVSVVTNPHS